MQSANKFNAKDAMPVLRSARSAFFLVALLALPELAMAEDSGSAADFTSNACTFLDNVISLLGIASVAVVTIAIVFAGYQIAFAHKRIADVAPILIGGVLIGGAGQLASWILQDGEGECENYGESTTLIIEQAVRYLS